MRIHHELYQECRELSSAASPNRLVIDSDSVKSVEKAAQISIKRVMMQARRSRERSDISSSIRKDC